MCHESSGVALSETLGIGKGSVTLEDLIIAIDYRHWAEPGTNHPRMLTALGKAKRAVRSSPLTHCQSWTHAIQRSAASTKMDRQGQKLTDLFLEVKINGDVALLKIIIKLLLEKERKSQEPSLISTLSKKKRKAETLIRDIDTYAIPIYYHKQDSHSMKSKKLLM